VELAIGQRLSKRRHAMRSFLVGAFTLLTLGVACGSGEGAGEGDRVVVGAVTFAENQIVAEMYARLLEKAGYEVDREFNYQNRERLLPDLESGSIDLAPEYLASLLTAVDPDASPSSDPAENIAMLRPLLAEEGLRLLEPSDANDTNAFVVTRETASRLDLESVSDLEPHESKLTLGGPPECPERSFCIEGLRDVYGIEFGDFRPLDSGGPLTVAALQSGEVDVALLFSTSGVIEARGWVVLEDNNELQSAENITPLIATDVLNDEITDVLNSLSGELSTRAMTELNARVEAENEDVRAVAEDFLSTAGLL
jgi:osmoprotectant transport system substrate-binding protein